MSRQTVFATGAAGSFGSAVVEVLLDIGYLVTAEDIH